MNSQRLLLRMWLSYVFELLYVVTTGVRNDSKIEELCPSERKEEQPSSEQGIAAVNKRCCVRLLAMNTPGMMMEVKKRILLWKRCLGMVLSWVPLRMKLMRY